MDKIKKLIFILEVLILLVVAFFIRCAQIDKIPTGFYADEAAIAYNAFSLLETGKDEYGKSWPLLFRSFGEYKTPTYSYLLIPIFKFFGKSVLSARYLTVISGFLSVIGLIFLSKIWFKEKKIVLCIAITFLLMPWSIIYSRSIYEVNLALTFLIWGLFFLELKIKNKKWNWWLGIFLFVLSIITYNGARIFTPLLGLIWLILNWKEIINKKNRWSLFITVLVGLIAFTPILRIIFTSGFWERSSINIFNGNTWNYHGSFKIYYQIKEWVSLYVGYLNPYYLFKLGDPGNRSKLIDMSLLFMWQLPFIVLGVKELEKQNKKIITFVLGLIFISPLAASLTRDPVSSIRSLFMVVPVSILAGLGMWSFIVKYKKIGNLILFSLFLLGAGRLYLSIFKITGYYNFRDWDYGFDKVVLEIKKIPKEMPIIFVGDNINYIQLAFYMANPEQYIKDNFKKEDSSYYTVDSWFNNKKINNLIVRNLIWGKDIYQKQIIVFGKYGLDDNQIKEHCLSKVFEIKGLDGKNLYVGVETNPELKLIKKEKDSLTKY